MPWLITIAAIAIASCEVTVRTVDGSSVEGKLASWDQSGLALSASSGPLRRITREDLAEITFRSPESVAATLPTMKVELVDGSVIPAEGCDVQNHELRINSPVGAGEQPEWTLPVNLVNAIRFDLSATDQDDSWRLLTHRERTSDLLVVHKKSSGTLDFVEGVIQQISAETVTIKLDEEPTDVPREKAFGVVFYHRESSEAPERPIKVHGLHQLLLVAQDVSFDDEIIEVELFGGGKIQLLPESVTKIEFANSSAANLVDLEIDVSSARWRPYFQLPSDSKLLAEWGQPRVNESFHGEPLRLLVSGEDAQPTIRGFERGLAMRSRSEATYQLPQGVTGLEAFVGIDPAAHADSEALLLIEADGEPLGEWRLSSNEPATSIRVEVSGKRKLRLLVDYGSGTDTGDIVHICEPRLVK